MSTQTACTVTTAHCAECASTELGTSTLGLFCDECGEEAITNQDQCSGEHPEQGAPTLRILNQVIASDSRL